ncbi:MAG TPA: alpha-amylase family glycosyl hydrolase [Phycisphaerales bacterium]|nr:alpha-amylase family glycosyl hydrolase [Phycisphaerales bacterium]
MRYTLANLAALTVAASSLAQPTTNPAPAAAPGEPKQAAAATGWWNDAVFYEVFVRSFADSTTGPLANDGIGDFQGLIDRLDYLKTLGIGALWLMPVTQSPSYHGYDTTDYRAIETDYGTNDDFKRFATECRKRGIKVIIDFVVNHCSDEHPWFREAVKGPEASRRDWFIWEETRPSWKGPWNQSVWHSAERAGGPKEAGFYFGLFNHDMPDLNFRNPAVTAEIHDTARFWLTDMGVDGFRLDAIRHLIERGQQQENTPETHAWLAEFQRFCKSVKPDCFTVGEVWSGTRDVAAYVNGGGMDSAFEFELEAKLVEALKSGKAAPLAKALRKSWEAFPVGAYGTFLTNHDQARIMTALKGDSAKARAGATILLTMPGIPFLYYGEEIGMTGDKPDPDIRTPMQWSAGTGAGFTTGKPWRKPNADANAVNVEAQAVPGVDSLLNHYKSLIRLRNSSPALRSGDLHVVDQTDPGLLVFSRAIPRERIAVVVNLGRHVKRLSDVTGLEIPPVGRQVLLGNEEGTLNPGASIVVRLAN